MNRHGIVQNWNIAAESLVRDRDGLTLVDGRLAPGNLESKAAFTRLFSEAGSSSRSFSAPASNYFAAFERSFKKRPLQAIVTPLPETFRCSGGELLLLVTDPDRSVNFPDDALRAFCNMTPAKTEVGNGLLMGYSAEAIASLRRVFTVTVRQQIKSMMNKTGASRQADMVRLFMTLPRTPASASQVRSCVYHLIVETCGSGPL